MEQQVKKYEIGFLVREESDVDEIKNALAAAKAEIVSEGRLKKLRLSYPIKKETVAHFGYYWFNLDTQAIKEMDAKLRLNSKVLRHILIADPLDLNEERAIGGVRGEKTEKTRERVAEKPAVKKSPDSDAVDNAMLEKTLEDILK
jgi:ribosomal protein S6